MGGRSHHEGLAIDRTVCIHFVSILCPAKFFWLNPLYRLVWAPELTPPAPYCDFSGAIFEVTLFFFESYYIPNSHAIWYFFTDSACGVITWPSWGYFLGNSHLFRKSTEYWIPPLNDTFLPIALTALSYDPTGAIFLVTKFLFWKVSHIDSYVIWYFSTHIASSVIQQPWWRYFWGNEIHVLNQYLILIPMWFDTFLPTSLAASSDDAGSIIFWSISYWFLRDLHNSPLHLRNLWVDNTMLMSPLPTSHMDNDAAAADARHHSHSLQLR